jgi:hypothetical protein
VNYFNNLINSKKKDKKLNIDNLTNEEIIELMEKIPDDVKELVTSLYTKNALNYALRGMKKWIDQDFDEDCPIDSILLMTAHQFVFTAGNGIIEHCRKEKEKGNIKYSVAESSQIVKKVLREIIDNINDVAKSQKNK